MNDNNKRSTEKGEDTTHDYLIAMSPGMVWANKQAVNLCIERHIQDLEKVDSGLLVSRYHPEDGSPAFAIISDKGLPLLNVVTMAELREFAELTH